MWKGSCLTSAQSLLQDYVALDYNLDTLLSALLTLDSTFKV